MTRQFRTRCRTPIGVHFNGRSLAAVQLSGSSGHWFIEAATNLRCVTDSGQLDLNDIDRFANVLDRHGFSNRGVVLAVTARSLKSAVLDLPPASSGAPLEQLAKMELARLHKCDAHELEAAYWELPAAARAGRPERSSGSSAGWEGGGAGATASDGSGALATTVMAAGCTLTDANAILDAFENQGFDAVALDIPSWAIARACTGAAALDGPDSPLLAVVDLGWNYSSVLMLHHGVVVYERMIDGATLQAAHAAIMTELQMRPEVADLALTEVGMKARISKKSDYGGDGCYSTADRPAPSGSTASEALAAWSAQTADIIASHMEQISREVEVSYSYVSRHYGGSGAAAANELGFLAIVGEGGNIPALADYFSCELKTTACVLSPAKLAGCPKELMTRCEDSGLTVAMGLAQYET